MKGKSQINQSLMVCPKPWIIVLLMAAFPPVSVAQELEIVGSCSLPTEQFCRSIYVEGDYAYLPKTTAGFITMNVHDPENPAIASYCDTVYVDDVVVQDNIAYFAASEHGIMTFDVSDPYSPIRLGSSDFWGDSHGIFVKGNLAYLAQCEHDLTIFNVVDPRNPIMICWFSIPFQFSYDVTVIGHYAYILDLNQGLTIVDVFNPADPFVTGTWDDVHVTCRFSIMNNIAYITTGGYEISVVDVSDVYNPTLITHYNLESVWAADVVAEDNNVYIAGTEIVILDVSNPANPVLLAASDFNIGFHSLFVRHDLIYLDGYDRFYIVRFSPSTSIKSAGELPYELDFPQNYPNPFNASTTISYSLPDRDEVTISIYNLLGQRVATIFEGAQEAGEHSITWDARDFTSGVYFARLEADGRFESIKMVLLE